MRLLRRLICRNYKKSCVLIASVKPMFLFGLPASSTGSCTRCLRDLPLEEATSHQNAATAACAELCREQASAGGAAAAAAGAAAVLGPPKPAPPGQSREELAEVMREVQLHDMDL